MTNDNQDALRCADSGLTDRSTGWQQWKAEAVAHIRRLVAENEEKESALKIVEATCDDFANQIEAKDALLRQAVEALDNLSTYDSRPSSIWRYFYPSSTGDYVNLREFRDKAAPATAAIRQHLEGRA